MKKLKIIHIHTDYKFIFNSDLFEGDLFDNLNVIIQLKENYPGDESEKIKLFKDNRNDRAKIVSLCKEADIVIVYDLNIVKCRIITQLPLKTVIIWRFFGYELYGKLKKMFLSEQSYIYEKQNQKNKFKVFIRKSISNINGLLRYKKTPIKMFYDAIKRLNYMYVLNEEEYTFLKQLWPILPPYLKFPIKEEFKPVNIITLINERCKTSPLVLLGNNRSFYNNHLDLIEIIERPSEKSNCKFIMLFNYGLDNNYAKAVRDTVNEKENIILIEDFLTKDEFQNFYKKPTALVLNSYRQLGVGNIFMAFNYGIKVYLNSKNVYYDWLKKEGFKVFSIEEFETDLKNNAIQPDLEVAEVNYQNLITFYKKENKESFQKELFIVLK